MTTTTTPGTTPAVRRPTLGALGGVLWALSPVPWLISDVRTLEPGTASFVAVLATHAALGVVGPALIALGCTGLPTALRGSLGRTGTLGAATAAVGLSAHAVGNAIEMTSLAVASTTSVVGYVISYLGFLVGFVGSLLVGIALVRRRRDAAVRIAGWLLALALPLGILVGLLFAVALPENEAGFSAAVSLPTGVAWAILGRSLARSRSAVPESAAAPASAR
jgi:hypothetical protein